MILEVLLSLKIAADHDDETEAEVDVVAYDERKSKMPKAPHVCLHSDSNKNV